MENQEVSNNASKAVLKSLSLETREDINRQIPALCTINSRVPYVLEDVFIADDTFQTNGRRWTIRPVWVQSSDNPLYEFVDPEKCEVFIYHYNARKSVQYRVHKSQREVYNQLFDEYIKDGTVVRGSLRFSGFPEFFKEIRENETDFKIRVTNLELEIHQTEDYENIIRFIDLDVLENVEFTAVENSLALLDKPEIKTFKNLTIFATVPPFPSVDQLSRLRNQHLQLEHLYFPLHELQLLVEDWISTGREIGTRFSWAKTRSENVVSMLDYFKTHFEALGTDSNLESYFSDKTIVGNSTTLKMGQGRELVMFCAKRNISSDWTPYTFEMEVLASTTTAGNVPTPATLLK